MRALHILILVVVGLIAVGVGFAEEYVGRIGDLVNYRSGALTLMETDVTLPGRRGLGVEITRYYSSQNYSDSIVAGASTAIRYEEYGSTHDYLGQGWHIEYPYMWEMDAFGYRKALRYEDGRVEVLLVNTDPVTKTNWPLKTRAGALATDNFRDMYDDDEILLTDGTKWVFALRLNSKRLLTNIVNKYGDTTHVSYFSGRTWIEKVTSPIGLEVLFQYGCEDSLYPGVPPGDTARLCRLKYLNHDSNYVEVQYDYDWSEQDGLLTKVIHPNGDSTLYGYTDTVYYQDVADYWDTSGSWADTIDYNNDNTYTADDLYFLNEITDAAGAQVNFTYRCFAVPIVESGDSPDLDSCAYQGRIGVTRRMADNDTVFIRYELSYPGLHTEYDNSTPITRVTTVDLPGGGKEEYWYFSDKEDVPGGSDEFFGITYGAGYHPGNLFQKHAIYDGDTVCTGFGYRQGAIGEFVSESGSDTVTIKAVDEVWTHRGVRYWWPQYGWEADSTNCFVATSSKDWWSTYSALDLDVVGLPFYNVEAERESDSLSTYGAGGYASSGWIPSPFPTDDVSFTVDSATDYSYISAHNIALVEEVWDFQQNDTMPEAKFVNYEYDASNKYVLEKAVTKLDDDYHSDSLKRTTSYLYNGSLMLSGTINPSGDTTCYQWDPTYNAFLWKKVDSTLGTLVTNEYYINGQMKRSIGLNNDTTEIYYDSVDRVVACRLPLETDTSAIKTFYSDSNMVTMAVKIDTGLTSMTRIYQDKYYRTVKTALEVDASTDIVDSIVYNATGQVEKTHRSKYADSGTTYWTQYYYDQSLQRVKTLAVDGTTDTSEVIDVYTSKYTDFRGNVTINVKDILGNKLVDTLITLDSSDTLVTTYNYDKHNNIISTTNPSGNTRYYEYDDWGRPKKILDSVDVGSTEVWRDSLGNLRLLRHNSEATYTYFKYDSDKRVIEEGTVQSADTTQIDTQTYPSSGNTVSLTNRYDSYSSSAIASDTAGGLGCSKDRLTEQRCFQGGDTVGVDFIYYDARGRVGLKTTWIHGMTDSLKLKYEYYANNALKKVTYPDNTETEYSLSQSGRIKGISGVIGIDSLEYEPWGIAKNIDFVNGLAIRNEYDSLSRVTKTLNYSSYMNLFSREYQYTDQYLTSEYDLDSDGDTTNLGEVRAFAFDTLGRLVSVFMEDPNESADTGTLTYDYDISNNLNTRYFSDDDTLTYTRFDGRNCDSLVGFSSDSTWEFTRNDQGQLTRIEKTSAGPLWDDRINYAYDHRGLLTSVEFYPRVQQFGDKPDSVQNLYNGAGQKVKQTHIYRYFDSEVGPRGSWVRIASDQYYIWSGSRVALGLNNPDSVSYINVYGLGQRLLRKDLDDASADSTCHYVNDFQNSVRSYVDSRGLPGDRMIEYYPYGGVYSQGGLGYTKHWFIGKEKDKTLELDFGPRYYNRSVGRFLAPDPIMAGPSPYSYSEGNPIMMSDPTGMAPEAGYPNASDFPLECAAEAARAEFAASERFKCCEMYTDERAKWIMDHICEPRRRLLESLEESKWVTIDGPPLWMTLFTPPGRIRIRVPSKPRSLFGWYEPNFDWLDIFDGGWKNCRHLSTEWTTGVVDGGSPSEYDGFNGGLTAPIDIPPVPRKYRLSSTWDALTNRVLNEVLNNPEALLGDPDLSQPGLAAESFLNQYNTSMRSSYYLHYGTGDGLHSLIAPGGGRSYGYSIVDAIGLLR
ncbi:MAG: DUF6531 domain-containing protein [candidate division Zixibacteria bacterium]|nr:DUF6531 domain-containing protein [candidate division Zixibacteria bacterium]